MAHEHAQTNRRPAQKDNVKNTAGVIKGFKAKPSYLYVVSQILTL